MNLSELTYRFCFKQIDEDVLIRFLMTQRDELLLDGETAVQTVIDRLFDHGGILAAFTPQNEVVGLIGFFFGDPNHNFENKEMLFLYVAAISQRYRLSRLFFKGMMLVMRKGKEMRMTHFQMQANVHDPYVNKLYGRMGKPLFESKTLRGHPVMTYGGSIEELIGRYDRSQTQTAHATKPHFAQNNSRHTKFFAPV